MKDEVLISLPKLGESIVSATVVQWFKKVGDAVALDEPLLEVSTDKVNSEIPSPCAGILKEIIVAPDREVEVGAPLAVLSLMKEGDAAKQMEDLSSSYNKEETESPQDKASETSDFLSPSVARLLRDKKIPLDQVDRIPRTGQGGRLTKKDVELFAQKKPACSKIPVDLTAQGTERVKMSGLRKAIAENMVKSFYEAPHASLVTEVDVTRLVKIIQENKQSFLAEHKAKLSITGFVACAIARAVRAFPLINASLEGDTIVMKRFINLGVAVSVDHGVMVPVIRGCHELGLPEISRRIADLAEKARTARLSPEEVRDGTLTMTNFGMTGTMIGIPIIRFPEVAIVGLGAITKKVAAMPDDSIAIRSTMWISLTFDHRVLDGLYGCGFLSELKKMLEEQITLN